MKNIIKILVISISLLVLLNACTPATTQPAAVLENTQIAATALPTEKPEPTLEPTEAPTAMPEPTEVPAPTTNITEGAVENYSSDVDYFPEKTNLKYLSGFNVEYFNNYKIVTIEQPWVGAESQVQYVLVQRGTEKPEGYDDSQIIEVPVKSIVALSTSYLPFLDAYGLLDSLVGVDDLSYTSNENVLAKADQMAVVGYGPNIDVERLLELEPDIIMTYGMGNPEYDAHPILADAGLKVVLNAEFIEGTPLGRAEWGKFIALFFNLEAKAEAQFEEIETRYLEIKTLAEDVDDKPTILLNYYSSWSDSWVIPGGQSFTAQLVNDAGGDYLWADDPNTGVNYLSFEEVYEKAADADIWLSPGFMATSADDVLANDERYADFSAFQSGQMWNDTAKMNANGGNDIYESGLMHPDIILADLIKIFHPELLPDHELYYYQKLD